ncbi:MAG: PKD domain-containing protein [Cyclobacteriaceae bacterium]
MKRVKKSINALLFFVLASIALTNCGKDDLPDDPTAPEACFTFTDEGTYAGIAVAFNADCSKNAKLYVWDFGDDKTSTEKNPTHTFAEEGNYTVTLIVTDSLERTAEFSQQINILPSPYIEHSGYIDSDEVWEEGLHLVKSTVKLRNGSLTIMPGAEIYLNEGRHIIVGDRETTVTNGVTLTAEGTADKPIIFKPSSGSTEPGSWGNILFTDGASDQSTLIYCELYYGGKGDQFSYPDFDYYTQHGFVDIDGQTVKIENTVIDGAANYGLLADNTFDDQFSGFSGNSIRNSENYCMYLDAKYLSNIGENNALEGKPVFIRGQYMASTAYFRNMGVPYQISFELDPAGGGTDVTIEAGTEIRFEEIAGFSLGLGSLSAVGTPTDPILFTSAQETKAAGDWRGLTLGENATVENCIIEYGGTDAEFNHNRPLVNFSASNSVVFKNNTVQYSSNTGMQITSSDGVWLAEVTDNDIKDITGYGMLADPSIVGDIPASNVLTNTKGFAIASGYVRKNATWPSGKYTVLGSINVLNTEPASLTLLTGTELLMTPKCHITVGSSAWSYGHLIADGVTFIKESTEAWGRIHINESLDQAQTSITNCIIDGGGFTQWDYESGLIYLSNLGSTDLPTITGNTLKNSINYGISTYATQIDVSNNTFENNALGETHDHAL